MPAPIVPAPITAACSTGRTGVSAGRSATFARRALRQERVPERLRLRDSA